jgi:hypothetical protein
VPEVDEDEPLDLEPLQFEMLDVTPKTHYSNIPTFIKIFYKIRNGN